MSRQGATFNETVQSAKPASPAPASGTAEPPNPLGVSLLLEVSQKSPNTAKIAELMARGASLEAVNAHGSTPLLVAARNGLETVADMLIQQGANINAQDQEGNTPLILAVIAGSVKTVRNLTDKGARLDHFNLLDRSALMWAAALGRREIAQILMRKGADLELQNHAGQTAYDIAKMHENHSLAAVLKAGAQQQKTAALTRPSSALRAIQYKDLLKKS